MNPAFPQPIELGTAFQMIPSQKPRTNDLDNTTIVDYMAFSNRGAAGVEIWVQDGNGKTLVPGIVAPGGQLMTVPLEEGGLLFCRGVWVRASVAGVVDCWARIILAAEKTG